nr:ECF transporter S component [Mycoplasmopsis bovis]
MNKVLNAIKRKWQDFSFFPKLTIRKISFIGILIAISVVIFVVFASFVPLISIPTYKISFIGLPIKISGLIFGPLVGGIVGLISDIISFSLFPTFYNFYLHNCGYCWWCCCRFSWNYFSQSPKLCLWWSI